jgi:chemotaxis protein CheD
MSPLQTEIPVFYLQPAEVFFSQAPSLVMTVLGSCISVTMFCARLGFGGICHVLLPKCRTDSCDEECREAYRYMDCSIKRMIKRFAAEGVKSPEIEVKIFGGSDILAVEGGRKFVTVGKQNIEVARKTLIDEGMKVRASHVGGTFGRKIVFFTHTGEVLMKKIKRSALPAEEIWRE